MCGRYGLIPGPHVPSKWKVSDAPKLDPNFNCLPGTMLPIVVQNSPRKITNAKWGFVPVWSKEPKVPFTAINARSESLLEKPMYKSAFKDHRCGVPASYYFEWKRDGSKKYPHLFRLASQENFLFAGLYSIWKDASGHEMPSFTICTTSPNTLQSPIHDRMPCILRDEDIDVWLNNDEFPVEKLEKILRPFDPDKMEEFEVTTLVNNPRNNGPEITAPLDPKNIKYLG